MSCYQSDYWQIFIINDDNTKDMIISESEFLRKSKCVLKKILIQ